MTPRSAGPCLELGQLVRRVYSASSQASLKILDHRQLNLMLQQLIVNCSILRLRLQMLQVLLFEVLKRLIRLFP